MVLDYVWLVTIHQEAAPPVCSRGAPFVISMPTTMMPSTAPGDGAYLEYHHGDLNTAEVNWHMTNDPARVRDGDEGENGGGNR